jgi:acyl-CoA synthetase (AMP-forming)/AMP-acid ligase II
MHDMACQYGHYFLSLGIQPGQVMAFYLQNSPEFAIGLLALWAIGCAPAFINYNLVGPALVHCLKVSGAEILLVDEDAACAARIDDQRPVIENELKMRPVSLDEGLRAHIASFPTTLPEDKLRRGMAGSFPSCVLYTSGTTGLPKGCALTMARLHVFARARLLNDRKGRGGDRLYDCMPFYHGTGAIGMMRSLLNGVGVAVGKKFSARSFWKDIRDSGSTVFMYVGETARYLLAAPPSPLDRDHKVRCMFGNGLRPDVWEKVRERFGIQDVAECFNSSEGVFGLMNYARGPYQAGCVGHHGALMRAALRNVYVPVAVDPQTSDILRDPVTGFAIRNSYSEGGEMLVAIPDKHVFQGYWRNPEGTAKKYACDVFRKGDLYYRTGDALRRTDDGHWHFLDRLGDTFRWKSQNVSTAEVAVVLGEFPGVLEANVYGVLVPYHEGRAGCAALLVNTATRSRFDFAGLARHARERLPRPAVPVFLRLVQASDHIHNHKQNKIALRTEGVDPGMVGTKVPWGRDDRFMWLLPDGDTYVEFGQKQWESLVEMRARL